MANSAMLSVHRVKSVDVVQKSGSGNNRWTELKIVSDSFTSDGRTVEVEVEITLFHLDGGSIRVNLGPSD